MLPFVIGGGIMIALAFLLDQIMGVPKDQLSQLGSYHEIAAQFKAIGGAAFGLYASSACRLHCLLYR